MTSRRDDRAFDAEDHGADSPGLLTFDPLVVAAARALPQPAKLIRLLADDPNRVGFQLDVRNDFLERLIAGDVQVDAWTMVKAVREVFDVLRDLKGARR